jgi:hypothetical protein
MNEREEENQNEKEQEEAKDLAIEFVPGFGKYTTKEWVEAYHYGDSAKMVEIGERLIKQYYGDADAEGKASLQYMMGHALELNNHTLVHRRAKTYFQQAVDDLSQGNEPRLPKDTLMGVWIERPLFNVMKYNDGATLSWLQENWAAVERILKRNRELINEEVAHPSGDLELKKHLEEISTCHYDLELMLRLEMIV